ATPAPPLPTLAVAMSSPRLHRDLHSFPTRRSSDLAAAGHLADRDRRAGAGAGIESDIVRRRVGAGDLEGRRLIHVGGTGSGATRSEEHTSELQSLAYLVCRLLLEKKNNAHRLRNSV